MNPLPHKKSDNDHFSVLKWVVVSAFQGVTDEFLSFSHSQERWNDKLAKLKKRHLETVNKLVKAKRDKRQVIECVENIFSELHLRSIIFLSIYFYRLRFIFFLFFQFFLKRFFAKVLLIFIEKIKLKNTIRNLKKLECFISKIK